VSPGVARSTLAWLALAIAGLVVAVSVSYAASQLSKPKVGLTSEPISGVTELAPRSADRKDPASSRSNGPPEHSAPTTTGSTPTTTTPVPAPHDLDDEGGHDDD
jgi:hypothetical protein